MIKPFGSQFKGTVMNYVFPELRHIDDVLPHIAGRGEFIVAERDQYKVINYVVAMENTFSMNGPDDLGGAIRRECRGLIFSLDGDLISRSYHKFHNIGEKEETLPNNLDMSKPHIRYEKEDGSMLRALVFGDSIYLASKMGITDVAVEGAKLLTEEQKEYLKSHFKNKKTVILEYVGPDNKIVLNYIESKLILTGIRDNLTGEYSMPVIDDCPFEIVKSYGAVTDSLIDYMEIARQAEGREGDVIRFATGQMVKLKNNWYVRIHKNKDLIRYEKNIAELIITETLDDVIPFLDSVDLNTVRQYEKRFASAIDNVLGRLDGLVLLANVLYGGNKKDVAIGFIPNLKYKEDASFIFSSLDGKDLRELVINKIKKSVGTITKYNDLIAWMEN